mmetsp:Transcript_100517/g.177054  ORF Transcript_100517/g.177054 Transcript_100517/m.177054 type:complete len:297 (-) Transcript_100517:82-972(-)
MNSHEEEFLKQYNESLDARIRAIESSEVEGGTHRDRSRSPRQSAGACSSTPSSLQGYGGVGGQPVVQTLPGATPAGQAMMQGQGNMSCMPMVMMPMGVVGGGMGMGMMPMGGMMMPMAGMMGCMNGMVMGGNMAAMTGAMGNPMMGSMMVGMDQTQAADQQQAQALDKAMKVIKAGGSKKAADLDDGRRGQSNLPPSNPASLVYRPKSEFIAGVTDRRHQGRIALFIEGEGYNYGYIECPALKKRYPQKDIFLHGNQKANFRQGDEVSFFVFVNYRGFPQATDLGKPRRQEDVEAE